MKCNLLQSFPRNDELLTKPELLNQLAGCAEYNKQLHPANRICATLEASVLMIRDPAAAAFAGCCNREHMTHCKGAAHHVSTFPCPTTVGEAAGDEVPLHTYSTAAGRT